MTIGNFLRSIRDDIEDDRLRLGHKKYSDSDMMRHMESSTRASVDYEMKYGKSFEEEEEEKEFRQTCKKQALRERILDEERENLEEEYRERKKNDDWYSKQSQRNYSKRKKGETPNFMRL